MAMYKLVKTNNIVQVTKDDQPMSLYRDIHDLNIALNNYYKIVNVLKYAAPLELNLSSSAIDYIINQ